MKAAQVDPAVLKIKLSEAQRIATEVPFVADKAVSTKYLFVMIRVHID